MATRKKTESSPAAVLASLVAARKIVPVDHAAASGLYVRELSQGEIERAYAIEDGATTTSAGFTKRLVALSLCGKDGAPAFEDPLSDASQDQLGDLPATAFEAIGRAALKVNGLDGGAEDAAGN
jgi:hypothetical protein